MPDKSGPQFPDNQDGLAGLIVPTARGWNAATVVASADICRSVRFRPHRALTVASMSFVVTSAATNNDNVQVGIYDSTGATLLASSSVTAGGTTSTGRKTVNLTANYTVLPNTTYYATLAYDYVSGTGATVGSVALTSTFNAIIAGSGAGSILCDSQSSATLPASLTFSNATSSGFLLFLNAA